MTPLILDSWLPRDPQTALVLADAMVLIHFAVVIFLVGGEFLILAGRALGWRWIGNRWFRGLHLLIMLAVATIAAMGEFCPLTTWENELRAIGNQPIDQASFLGHWAHRIVHVELDLQTLSVCYVLFALLVIASAFMAPVRWRRV
jgi:hypothetical protein